MHPPITGIFCMECKYLLCRSVCHGSSLHMTPALEKGGFGKLGGFGMLSGFEKLPSPRISTSPWRRARAAMKAEEGEAAVAGARVVSFEVEQLALERPSLGWVNSTANSLSKWVMLVGAAAVVLWRRDDAVVWAVLGSLVNGGNSKVLKRLINQERPASALHMKSDPGMPSTHGQSLGYLSAYAALGYIGWQGLDAPAAAVASLILVLGAYMAWLRVAEGMHTPAQVVAGVTIGSAFAGLWLWLWLGMVGPLASSNSWVRYGLFTSFVLAAVFFYGYSLRKWKLGED